MAFLSNWALLMAIDCCVCFVECVELGFYDNVTVGGMCLEVCEFKGGSERTRTAKRRC